MHIYTQQQLIKLVFIASLLLTFVKQDLISWRKSLELEQEKSTYYIHGHFNKKKVYKT